MQRVHWRFERIRGTFLGGPYNRNCNIWGPLFVEAAIRKRLSLAIQ